MSIISSFEEIPVSEIKTNKRFRKDIGDMQLLAKSILHVGLLNPITVKHNKDGSYTLLAGFRRLKAFEILGRDKIMAHIMGGDE